MSSLVVVIAIMALIALLLVVKPTKFLKMLLANAVIGLVLFFLVNLIGSDYGVSVRINEYTASVSGLLGIPGVVAIIVIENIIL